MAGRGERERWPSDRAPPSARYARHQSQRHGGGGGGQDVIARLARFSGQHVLHDQRSARHHRSHVLLKLCVHITYYDVRTLLHRPVAS